MNMTDWLIGISALATLALAIAAFLSIRQNRLVREQDFSRQRLDNILNWAQTGLALLSEEVSVQHRHNIELLLSRLEPIHTQRESMLNSSKNFGINFVNAVFKAVTRLESYFDLANKIAKGPPQPEAGEQGRLVEAKQETHQAFVELLKSVTDLKVELRL